MTLREKAARVEKDQVVPEQRGNEYLKATRAKTRWFCTCILTCFQGAEYFERWRKRQWRERKQSSLIPSATLPHRELPKKQTCPAPALLNPWLLRSHNMATASISDLAALADPHTPVTPGLAVLSRITLSGNKESSCLGLP